MTVSVVAMAMMVAHMTVTRMAATGMIVTRVVMLCMVLVVAVRDVGVCVAAAHVCHFIVMTRQASDFHRTYWKDNGRESRGGSLVTAGGTLYPSHQMGRPSDFYRPLPPLGAVSSIGAGTYLGECDDADDTKYRAALHAALAGGVTLIDTAINYRCQRAERTIGQVLRAWRHRDASDGAHAQTSDETRVVLCTKGGYVPLDDVPPGDKAQYREYVQREYLDTGIVPQDELVAGGHCVAPSFLADQIRRSQANLGVDCIDLYYVHNPEQQLGGMSRDTFEQRMRAAFEMLESQVAGGAIRAYGCATWHGFRVPPDSVNALQLERLVQLAKEVGGEQHHFAAVQLPLSLGMPEAIRVPTQSVRGTLCTFLQAAHELGVAVIASAPLMHGQLTRGLPQQLHDIFPAAQTDAQRAIGFARNLPGVASVLVGMRDVAHVTENLAVIV